MDKLTELSAKISVDPENLNGSIERAVREKLEEKYLNKCSGEHGYILEIVGVLSYKINIISPITALPLFEVKFTVKNIKPEIGQKVKGVVETVNKEFILIKVLDKIDVLVSCKELKNSQFVYNRVGVCFKNKKTSIRQGDLVSLEISDVRYKKDYKCLGRKVETAELPYS